MADDCKNCGPQIWCERCRVCEIFFETFAAAGNYFRVIQISQSADQARAEVCGGGRLPLFLFPAEYLKYRTQKRLGITLKFFSLPISGYQPRNESQPIDYLFAFGDF